MTIGFVFVDLGRGTRVGELASILIRSIRRTMPDVEIVQMTDERTKAITGVDSLARRPMAKLALGTLEHYAAVAGEWLLLDTDVIVQEDVRSIFDVVFDVAVADREGTLLNKEVGTKFMAANPHNKGAVFSRSPAFWASAVERCREYSDGRQKWMGDQQAMNETITGSMFNVRVLDSRYNFAPRFPGDEEGKAIVHYKGVRKEWMIARSA